MRRWLVAVALIVACKKPAPPPPLAPDAGAATAVTPPTTRLHHSLLRYEGFSPDGLVFVYAELGAAGPQLHWLSSTTNTIEKTMPLLTPEQRDAALAALQDDGMPQVGTIAMVPPQVSAELREGQVQVLFGPMPGGKPFKPFAEQRGLTPQETQVVAVTKDGKRAAVRTTGRGGDAGALFTEYRVVSLFE